MAKILVYQDLNPLSPTFSQWTEVETVYNCSKECPPTPQSVTWIPMLHEWLDEEPLSWSNVDSTWYNWKTPIFYNLSGREVYIDWGDGSNIEKTRAVAVKHRYTTRGTFTPMIGFDEDPIWDFTYKYDGASNYSIIAPVLVEDWTGKDITYLRGGIYKNFITQYPTNRWELITITPVVANTERLYFFPNDRSGDYEWRYLTIDEGQHYSVNYMYFDDSVETSLNYEPFIVYNYDNISGKTNIIKQFPLQSRSIDNSAIIVDGTKFRTLATDYTDSNLTPYGEVLWTGPSKQFKMKNLKDFLYWNPQNSLFQFTIGKESSINPEGLKIVVEFGSRTEVYRDFSSISTTVSETDIQDFTLTASCDDIEGLDLYFELALDTVNNKISGIRLAKW